jgi:Domain of unknown function (DUF4169)
MGDIVNLRRVRKRAQRQAAEQKAAANRQLHGRSNTQRKIALSRNAKNSRDLDAHRIETGDEK